MRRLACLFALLVVSVASSCGRDELVPAGYDVSGGNPGGGVIATGGFFMGTGGQAGTGGTPTGGAPSGGAPSGGAPTGGKGTGGGGATGGTRTGGVGTGGVPTGGVPTGGVPTGGKGTGGFGGVSTGGVSTGGFPATGAVGGGTPTPGLVTCGTQICVSAKDSCCVGGSAGAPTTSCIPAGGVCPGISIGCDEPADCSSGDVCCLGVSFGGQMSLGVGSTCTSQANCRGTGFVVCRTSADCPNRQGCCAQPGTAGICRAGC